MISCMVKCEDGGKIHVREPSGCVGLVGDQDILKSEITCDDNLSFNESVDNKHTYDHDGHINQQDQANETFNIVIEHLDHHIVDQEHQEPENEQVAQEVDVGSVDEIEKLKMKMLKKPKWKNQNMLKPNQKMKDMNEPNQKAKKPNHEETKPYAHEETHTEEAEHEETKTVELEIKEDDV